MWVVILVRLDYYVNIMLEKLDWGSLDLVFLDMEEISSDDVID